MCNDCYRNQSRDYRAKELGLSAPEYQDRINAIAIRRGDRHCKKCGVELTATNWGEDYRKANYRICRRCRNEYTKEWLARNPERRKNYRLRLVFGITLSEARAMWEKQGRKCWLCQRYLPFAEAIVEHNHRTNQIRGLAHNTCNTIAGMAREDPDLLIVISQSLRANDLADKWTELAA
jgi:hypothetical protein